ncbi:Grap2 and cyclin-D-interacting-domain-containing protein [Cubamyces menziesii]|nr:Grap2 and cyclin-D-interacting-domain-containing protein [Cubamyces menziesii]
MFSACSDRHQHPALSALRLLKETCSAALDALKQPLSSTQISLLSSPPSSAILHKDFQSLLTLIYTSTTKLTLVLRPSAPAPKAALGPINDLGTSITSLATCATLFDLYGSTLSSYARRASREICDSVISLANTFVEDSGDEYLVRTGTVHDLIEKARRELPVDNLAAVKMQWKADRGMLEDSLNDINAMIEDAGDEGDDDLEGERFDDDDELDELGFGPSKKLSDVELERVKKVQPLVRFGTLLHKRIVPDVLANVSGSGPELLAALDALPSHSHSVVLAVEELVASLYAPQKPAALSSAVTAFSNAIHQLHASAVADTLLSSDGDVAKQMSALTLDGGEGARSNGDKQKDPRRWFDACLAQIDKSARAVDELLALDSAPTT